MLTEVIAHCRSWVSMMVLVFNLESRKSRSGILIVLLAAMALTGCTPSFDEDLAFRHAPVHFQDTDDTNAVADFITAVDYDGDWETDNNWDNLFSSFTVQKDLSAKAYYSVVESCTHWFVVYGFYHAWDWVDGSTGQEHENDLEGLLAIVRKDGSEFGRLDGIITVFHTDFFSYVPSNSSLTDGNQDIGGPLSFQVADGISRFKTSQEAKGHGLKAWPFAGNFSGAADQDGIVYFPTLQTNQAPESGNDRNASYELVHVVRGMWFIQLVDAPASADQRGTFVRWGVFRGDGSGSCGDGTFITCPSNKAHAPWGWDDGDDGPTFAGEMALDPIHLVDHYFNGLGAFSDHYARNLYIEDLQQQGYDDGFLPDGWPNQISLPALYSKLEGQCP